MSKVLGKDIILAKRASDTYVTIAYATECELSVDRDMVEICSTSTGAYRAYRPGRKTWTIKGNYVAANTTFTDLVNLIDETSAITFRMNISGTNFGVQGTGYISSVSLDAPDGEIATYSIVIQGTGTLSAINTNTSDMEIKNVASNEVFRAIGSHIAISPTSSITALSIKYSNDNSTWYDVDYTLDNTDSINIACVPGQFFKVTFSGASTLAVLIG